MRLLRTINRLKDPRDLWLFLQILTMLILLPRLIRRKDLPDLMQELDPGVAKREPDLRQMEKTAGFIDSLLRYRIFQRYGKCLLRSLVLFRFLRRQGWPVEVHFGVRKVSDGEAQNEVSQSSAGITGHSWLMLDQKPFLEDNHSDYSLTYFYPRPLD